MGWKDKKAFTALAEMTRQRLDQFNAQDLTNTAWAFATVVHEDEQLFKVFRKAR